MPKIVPQVVIAGRTIPVSSFRTQRGSYGAIGTCAFTTDVEQLKTNSLNILKANQAAVGGQLGASLPIVISISTDGGNNFTKLWTGDMDDADFDFQGDTVTIRGRDQAARLFDDRVVLKADEYQNKRPYEIAIKLAGDYGLTPKVTVDRTQPLAGDLYKIDAVSLPLPRPKWDLLVFLARSVGWEVFAGLDNDLFFGPAVPGKPHKFTWKMNDPSAGIPVMNLHMEYQPRRNMTFQILVMSQHAATEEVYSERIMVINQEITIDTVRKVKAGVYKGSAAQRLRSAISSKLDGRPLYIFYPQGKTLQQVQGLAERIYYDIARKLFVASGEVDGLVTLNLQDSIQLVEANAGDLQGFAGQQLSLVSVAHRFQMAPRGKNEAGFVTDWKAHFLPASPSSGTEDPILVTGGEG